MGNGRRAYGPRARPIEGAPGLARQQKDRWQMARKLSGFRARSQTFRGQLYEFAGSEEHICATGKKSIVNVWRSTCPECGSAFRYSSTRKRLVAPNRRCERHRAPGKPVASAGNGVASSSPPPPPPKKSPPPSRPEADSICAAAAQALAAGHRFGEWRTIPSLFWIAPSDAWRVLREGKDRSQRVRIELAGRSEVETRYGTVQVEERGDGRWYFRLPARDGWTELAARYPWLG